MFASLSSLAILATISQATPLAFRAGTISCGAPISTGTLWYGSLTGSYEGQIGVVEAYGNAPLLAAYPNNEVVSLSVNILPCNSSYLDATIPSSTSSAPIPVILQAVDDTTECVQLQSTDSTDVFVVKQTCSETDDYTQAAQFWTMSTEYGTLLPTYETNASLLWNLQFNQYDTIEIIANPPVCPSDGICQYGEEYAFVVKESS